MKKLMNRVMLSCKSVTELIEKKSVVKIYPKEELQLFMHTRFCKGCSLYQKQSKTIDQALQMMKVHFTLNKDKPEHRLKQAVKNEILRRVRAF